MSVSVVDRIDIHEPVAEICRRLELDVNYVAQIDILPYAASVTLFKGRDGRCQGAKYIDETTKQIAVEVLDFKVNA